LEFFYVQTAPALSSYFDADFWTRLVLQMSHAEPVIKHAVVAVGALHRQRESVAKLAIKTVRDSAHHNDPFALTQYNRAIGHLSKRMQDNSADVEVALLASILFVCVEFLRGDTAPAVSHFQGGMSIAMSTLPACKHLTASERFQGIRHSLLPFFHRLELLATVLGNAAPWEYPVALTDTVPSEPQSLGEARDSLVHVMNLSLRLIEQVKTRRDARTVTTDDLNMQAALLRQLEAWQAAFDAFLLTTTVGDKDKNAAKVLQIHQIVTVIWLSTSTYTEESAQDAFIPEFENAVELAEAIRDNTGTKKRRETHTSSFLFDMETVSPIYYVATNCRHPLIRRRATAVLRSSLRREGLWDSLMAAAIADRVTAIEEANLSVFDGSELPREEDRVHKTQIVTVTGMAPDKPSVTFCTRPNGLDGEWKFWEEVISL